MSIIDGSITPFALSEAANLRRQNEELRALVLQLCQCEEELCEKWYGADRDAFHEAFRKDIAVTDNFYRAVCDLCNDLEKLEEMCADFPPV